MAGEGKRRIIDMPEASTLSGNNRFAIDSETQGTKSVTASEMQSFVNAPVIASLSDEVARAKSEEERLEALFTTPTQEAVNNWLDAHPEATTTVQDGSVTVEKLSNDVQADFRALLTNPLSLSYGNTKYFDMSTIQGPDYVSTTDYAGLQSFAFNSINNHLLLGFRGGASITSNGLLVEADKDFNVIQRKQIDLEHCNDITFNPKTNKYYVASGSENKVVYVINPSTLELDNTITLSGLEYGLAQLSYKETDGITANISTSSRLKVMTYNMGHYNYGVGVGLPPDIYDEKLLNYRRFFGEQNCDVIGIQEYDTKMDAANTINSADVLWNHSYPSSVFTGSSTALRSRIRIFDGKYSQLSTGRYYCEGTMNSIYLLSVHLSVGVSNTQTRLDEADEIISTLLAGKERFIMFGDFNPEPGEEEALYKKFTDAGDNIANCGWFGKYYTWSNNRADFDDYENPTGTRLYYLDNIITSANIKIENVYPIPSAYKKLSSDHIPLVAELDIK